jgi:hypothetical protein
LGRKGKEALLAAQLLAFLASIISAADSLFYTLGHKEASVSYMD